MPSRPSRVATRKFFVLCLALFVSACSAKRGADEPTNGSGGGNNSGAGGTPTPTVAPNANPAPTLTSVTPGTGPLAGDTAITLAGTNFINNAKVKVGGLDCLNVTFVTALQITCKTPAAMTPGLVNVQVINPDTQSATLVGGFNYADPNTFSPMSVTGAPPPIFLLDFFINRPAIAWTGKRMIVWGRQYAANAPTGGQYDPVENKWYPMSTVNAPSARIRFVSQWTGTKLLVWGGAEGSNGTTGLNTGALYDPAADKWTPMSMVGAPSARSYVQFAWTGKKLLVWGGIQGSTVFVDGAQYDPATDKWTPITSSGAPGVRLVAASSIWSGTKWIIWGGQNTTNNTYLNTGGVYDPETDTWTAMTTTNAPAGRTYPFSFWSGTRMVVWGGTEYAQGSLSTGGQFDPVANKWTAISSVGIPGYRQSVTTVWTGTEMITWGGATTGVFNSGYRYNPATDTWTAMSLSGAPTARESATGFWTGKKLMIFGGAYPSNGSYITVNTGAVYDPANDTWTAMPALNTPSARDYSLMVGIPNRVLIWSGRTKNGSADVVLNDGAQYTPP